jgi:transcriptional regulator with XRE-family HTH domain
VRDEMIKLRKKLNLTQKQVADYLGKTRTAYSAYELGRNEPPLVDIIKLKTLFKTKDDTIFLDSNVTKHDAKSA